MFEKDLRRFLTKIKVHPVTECWEWQKGLTSKGYSQFWYEGPWTGHTWAVRFLKNQLIPPGFQVDHMCANKRCVNPDHLRVCTPRENMLAEHSNTAAKLNLEKKLCPEGHSYSGFNSRGARVCRQCMRSAAIRWEQKHSIFRVRRGTRTHCKKGHVFTGKNVRGEQICRVCMRAANIRYEKRKAT